MSKKIWIKIGSPSGDFDPIRVDNKYLELPPEAIGSKQNPQILPFWGGFSFSIGSRPNIKPGTYYPGLNPQAGGVRGQNQVGFQPGSGWNGASNSAVVNSDFTRWPVGALRQMVAKATIQEGFDTTNLELLDYVRIWFKWDGFIYPDEPKRSVEFPIDKFFVSIPVSYVDKAITQGLIKVSRFMMLRKNYVSTISWNSFLGWLSPITETVVEPVVTPITEPVTEPIVTPITDPVDIPIEQPPTVGRYIIPVRRAFKVYVTNVSTEESAITVQIIDRNGKVLHKIDKTLGPFVSDEFGVEQVSNIPSLGMCIIDGKELIVAAFEELPNGNEVAIAVLL